MFKCSKIINKNKILTAIVICIVTVEGSPTFGISMKPQQTLLPLDPPLPTPPGHRISVPLNSSILNRFYDSSKNKKNETDSKNFNKGRKNDKTSSMSKALPLVLRKSHSSGAVYSSIIKLDLNPTQNSRVSDKNSSENEIFDDIDCGDQFLQLKVGDNGTIQSSGYPDSYEADMQCVWWIEAERKDAIVSLTCDDVLTQACDNGKYFDYLLVSPDWSWDQYYLICGDYSQNTPFILKSKANQMSLYFRTSLKKNFRGFKCHWTVESNETEKTGPRGISFNAARNCGEYNEENERIVGGINANPHEFPWMIGLSFNSKWFCGGTLLNKQWIITAAHCTHDATSCYAYVGAHNLYATKDTSLILYTDHFVEHPDYNSESIANDIALVKLPQKIKYTAHISPVCLPLRSELNMDMTGLRMVAAGWGKTENGATISPLLNKLNVTIVSNEDCKKSYGDIIKETNICAIGDEENQSTCQGDSGSALQIEVREGMWIQQGVVSFGPHTGCGTGHPNGYSKIGHYFDFIEDVTGITLA